MAGEKLKHDCFNPLALHRDHDQGITEEQREHIAQTLVDALHESDRYWRFLWTVFEEVMGDIPEDQNKDYKKELCNE